MCAANPGSTSSPSNASVEEAGDDPLALVVAQLREFVHPLHLLWVAAPLRATTPSTAFCTRRTRICASIAAAWAAATSDTFILALQHPPDRREVDPQVAQGPHKSSRASASGP